MPKNEELLTMGGTGMQASENPGASVALDEPIRQLLAEILYVEPREVDLQRTFLDLGLDSVLAVEFTVRLRKAFKISLQVAELYEMETPAALVSRLETR